ncbi:hypothetical protein F2Q69_00007974 [Brassica cretica]|uniref:Uncharacterized protein n=1 Tax=Brassica cretica TaxID=69181 RepID=A0A8S9P1A0_BRACR|nr:hypothetical protein F2Q69_00007974 [Brassica cretica]
MQSVWKVPGHASDVNPPAFITGEPPPILPPDPPDPTSPLSPANFPTLTETATKTIFSGSSRKGPRRESKLSATTSFAPQKTQDTITCSGTISMEIEKENPTLSIIVTVPESESESATVQSEVSETNFNQNYTILPPQENLPLSKQTKPHLLSQPYLPFLHL